MRPLDTHLEKYYIGHQCNGHHYETPEVPLSLTLPHVAKSDDTCLLSGGHHVNLSPTHCVISHSPPSSAAPRFAVGFPR